MTPRQFELRVRRGAVALLAVPVVLAALAVVLAWVAATAVALACLAPPAAALHLLAWCAGRHAGERDPMHDKAGAP